MAAQPTKKTRVLILGGGFGGLYAALEFERRREPGIEVTLVTQDNFFLFTPMLHEVAASDLDLTHIVNPIRKMLSHVNFSMPRCEASICPTKPCAWPTPKTSMCTACLTTTW